jgi:hypothetical protein
MYVWVRVCEREREIDTRFEKKRQKEEREGVEEREIQRGRK